MDNTTDRPPLGFGDLISGSFTLFFRRFPLFFGIAILPAIVLQWLETVATRRSFANIVEADTDLSLFSAFSGEVLLVQLLSYALTVILGGIITLAAYDVLLGHRPRVGAYISKILTVFLPLVVMTFVYSFLVGVGMILLILPGLYVMGCFAVLAPAIIIDRAGWGALARSAQLTRGYRWAIIGCIIVLSLIILVPSAALAGVLVGTAVAVGDGTGLTTFGLPGLVEAALNAVFVGIFGVFTARLYARLREIKEGLGLEDISLVFE